MRDKQFPLLIAVLPCLFVISIWSVATAEESPYGAASELGTVVGPILIEKLVDSIWGKENTPGYEDDGDGLIGIDEAKDALDNAAISDDDEAVFGSEGASSLMLDPSIPIGSPNNRQEQAINPDADWLQNSYDALSSTGDDEDFLSESYESCQTYTVGNEVYDERDCEVAISYDAQQCTEERTMTGTVERAYRCPVVTTTSNVTTYTPWSSGTYICSGGAWDNDRFCPAGLECSFANASNSGSQCSGSTDHRYKMKTRMATTSAVTTRTVQCSFPSAVCTQDTLSNTQATYTCTDWLSTASNATLLSEEFTVLSDTWQGCSELHAQQCPVTAYEEGEAETRSFYGYTVEDVFERSYSYACVNGVEEDVGGSCQVHLDDGCDYLEDVCLFTNSG
nr:hypothetical protein [Alphaproteobacteria bacterium]